MLSATLRIELIVLAVAFLIIVGAIINKGRMQLRYALIWIFSAMLMILLAVFPAIAVWATRLMGFETTSNFVFFCAIAFLLILTFGLTIVSSRQSERIKTLTQEISIMKYEKDHESAKDE